MLECLKAKMVTHQGLDLVEPLYIGGMPGMDNLNKDVGFTRGFVGCISRVALGPRNRLVQIMISDLGLFSNFFQQNIFMILDSHKKVLYTIIFPDLHLTLEAKILNKFRCWLKPC